MWNKQMLFLDLDGVMFDFESYFLTKFGMRHDDVSDDEMWSYINSHPTFFAELPLMPGAYEFFQRVKHLNPIILTACPRHNYYNAAKQKRKAAREHLDSDLFILPVLGGKNKALFMHSPGDILIDDFDQNIKAWENEGGTGILHRQFDDTLSQLWIHSVKPE